MTSKKFERKTALFLKSVPKLLKFIFQITLKAEFLDDLYERLIQFLTLLLVIRQTYFLFLVEKYYKDITLKIHQINFQKIFLRAFDLG